MASINQSLIEQIDKNLDDGSVHIFIHGKLGTVPIAGATELFELLQNDSAVLIRPFPSIFKEFLSAKIGFVDSLGLQFSDNLGLRRNRGMIHTRHPAGIFAHQTCTAD